MYLLNVFESDKGSGFDSMLGGKGSLYMYKETGRETGMLVLS